MYVWEKGPIERKTDRQGKGMYMTDRRILLFLLLSPPSLLGSKIKAAGRGQRG